MPSYSVSLWRADGNSERYSGTYPTPRDAAKHALGEWEKFVAKRIAQSDPGSERRLWEKLKVPRFLEVSGSDGRIVEKFNVKDV